MEKQISQSDESESGSGEEAINWSVFADKLELEEQEQEQEPTMKFNSGLQQLVKNQYCVRVNFLFDKYFFWYHRQPSIP